MFLVRTALLFVTLSLVPRSAVAGIVISIDDGSVSPGAVFTLNVRVQGDMSYNAMTERLDFFIGTFRITTVGLAPAGSLTFDNPQVDGFDSDTNYVFFNNTFGLARDVTADINGQDTLTISDGTSDFLGIDVTNSFLLARLELTADPALLGITQFQVSLVGDESQFQNEAFDDISFSSTGGLITVNGPTAVPEPGTLLLLSMSVATVGLRMRIRRKGRS